MRNNADSIPASRRATTLLAAVVLAGSVAALVGWLIDSATLKSVLPGRVAMNPATAVSLLAAAVSLSLAAVERCRRVAMLLGAAVTGMGAACVTCYYLGADVTVDRLLFASQLGDNRMAPNTGACLLLAGAGLWTLQKDTQRRIADVVGSALACWSFLSIVGYVFGSRSFYGLGTYIPMAVNTAVLLHLLGLGLVLCISKSWLASIIDANTAGAVIGRRLIPAAFLVPLAFGWLRLRGQDSGLYDTEFGAALLVVATIAVTIGVIVWAVRSVDAAMARSAAAEAVLHERQIQYRLLVEGIYDYAIFLMDRDGNVKTWNEGAQRIMGCLPAHVIGRHFSQFYPAEALVQGKPVAELAEAVRHGRVRDEGWRIRSDGTQFWASTLITAMFDDAGKLTGFSKITRDMTAQQEYQQRLANLNDELERHVVLRTSELADAIKDLSEKNRENETFVYSVSHDLRSPLVNLQGFSSELEMICDEIAEALNGEDVPAALRKRVAALVTPGMKEPIHFIRTAVTRLSAIIDALLRLSRAGRIEYQIGEVDLNELIQRIVDSSRMTIAERGAQIHAQPLPPVRGDAIAVEQIFANLIGNALNYLDPERPGLIDIGVLPEAETSESGGPVLRTYFVRDNGLGIPAASRGKIFQAFQRLHPTAARGEGMGLTIVRRVVERHGGRIWLDSAENQGTTFYVSLPEAVGVPRHSRAAGASESALEAADENSDISRQEGMCHVQ